LYRSEIPIQGEDHQFLRAIDLHPENVEQTIVFQHGYAGVGESWEYQINHFASHYRVVVPDLRGHGQSDAPYSQYTMDELVADMHAIVEHLQLPERFILVGHSFGGSVCVEYANAHPERIEKLILIATAGEYPLPKAVSLISKIPSSLVRPLWRYRPKWDAEIHVMKRMMLNNLRKWKGWPLLRNLNVDTLIITGERDNYFPREVFDDVGRMVPNAEVVDVGSAKHKVQLERHQAVNRAMERFLGDHHQSWRNTDTSNGEHDKHIWTKQYGENIPTSIPIPQQPMHKFLESAASWRPKHTAVQFYGHKFRYDDLNAQANQLARALQDMGGEAGDRVMIVMPNMPHYIVAYYAILKCGGVVVLPNPDADAEKISAQIQETQSKVLITLTAFKQLAKVLHSKKVIENIIFVDMRRWLTEHLHEQILARIGIRDASAQEAEQLGVLYDECIKKHDDSNLDMDVAPDALANINYTSGTTDKPRGVCLTHTNLVANALQTRHWVPDLQYGKEIFLSVLPFSHSYGMTSAMNTPITIAATMVILSYFDVGEVLRHIKKYHPTIFPGVPFMYSVINQAPRVREYGLSSIKACISGAAPLPIEVQEAFEKLTHGRLVEGYGLTEASPVTHANPLYGVRKVGSIGIPLPNTDARIVDLVTDEILPAGQIGELTVKGPQVMSHYWQVSPEEAALHVRDGWLYTGDLAVMDSDGYFQIVSRKRDTILSGKYSIYPRDVEEVLYENNKVLEAAVVGIGRLEGEQKIKAFVVPRPNTTLSEEELIKLCRRRLEEYAVPAEIEFRKELPKSFVGKVLRRVLVEEV
jgi:long-chain acyl-CoA synthetase